MMRWFTYGLLVVLPLLAGCDSANYDEWVRPTITVDLQQPDFALKNQVELQVALFVNTRGGQDFSPEPVTVDTEQQSQVVFDVSLPPDSIFVFRVQFRSSNQLVGEGAVVEEITRESSEVSIPVRLLGAGGTLALVPSLIRTSATEGSIPVVLRYYGRNAPVVGIATVLRRGGDTVAGVDFRGADITTIDGNETSLAWQFAPAVSGVEDLGSVRIPLNQTGSFCIEIPDGHARTVTRSGEISIVPASGSCVVIRQNG